MRLNARAFAPVLAEPVSHLHAYPGVAGLAESHEVLLVVRSAMAEWKDVMYLRRHGQPAFLPALLAQRVCGKEPGTNLLPCAAVPPLRHRVAAVLLVVPALQFPVFLAVPFLREPWAAWVPARVFRLPRHPHHLRA